MNAGEGKSHLDFCWAGLTDPPANICFCFMLPDTGQAAREMQSKTVGQRWLRRVTVMLHGVVEASNTAMAID
jgi:hypothetical protein